MNTELFMSHSLKKLSNDDLVEQIISIRQQSELLVWIRWSTLRGRFKSTQEFGNFLKPWRIDPDSPLFNISDSTMKRMIQAGRMAEKLKIDDFNSLGMSVTTFYFLSETGNQDIAIKLFNTIKRKGYRIDQVKQIASELRNQQSVVSTIEHEEVIEPLPVEPTPLRIVKVEKGRALDYQQTDIVETVMPEAERPVITVQPVELDYIDPLLRKFIDVSGKPYAEQYDEEAEAEQKAERSWSNKTWTDAEMVDAVNDLLRMFGVSWLKEVFILETCKKQRIEKGYSKKLG